MIWLILGVALWWAAHLFKRAAPGPRARLGDAGKGAVAVALLVSVVLMVIGYRQYAGPFFWAPHPALVGINNLLVLAGFYFFAASGTKAWVTTRTRHPQLIGFSLWAVGHLLVNGDMASFILFGGLLAWALVEMAVISAAEPWTPPRREVKPRKEVTTALSAVAVYFVVAAIHGWLGVWPFG